MTNAIAREGRTALARARASFARLFHVKHGPCTSCGHYDDEHAERCFGLVLYRPPCPCKGYTEERWWA